MQVTAMHHGPPSVKVIDEKYGVTIEKFYLWNHGFLRSLSCVPFCLGQ